MLISVSLWVTVYIAAVVLTCISVLHRGPQGQLQLLMQIPLFHSYSRGHGLTRLQQAAFWWVFGPIPELTLQGERVHPR